MDNTRKKVAIPAGIIAHANEMFDLGGFTFPDVYYDFEHVKKRKVGELDEKDICAELKTLAKNWLKKFEDSATPKELMYDWKKFENIKHQIEDLTDYNARYYLPEYIDGDFRDYKKSTFPSGLQEWHKIIARETIQIYEKEKVEYRITSEYLADENEIVVYVRAIRWEIESEADTTLLDESKVRKAIAHALFHAIHRHLAPKTYQEDSPEAEVIREALADYYSFILTYDKKASLTDSGGELIQDDYSVQEVYGYSTNNERKNYWSKWKFSQLPHAKAIFMEFHLVQQDCSDYEQCKASGAIDKFLKVLEVSKTDMKAAYWALIPRIYQSKACMQEFPLEYEYYL